MRVGEALRAISTDEPTDGQKSDARQDNRPIQFPLLESSSQVQPGPESEESWQQDADGGDDEGQPKQRRQVELKASVARLLAHALILRRGGRSAELVPPQSRPRSPERRASRNGAADSRLSPPISDNPCFFFMVRAAFLGAAAAGRRDSASRLR